MSDTPVPIHIHAARGTVVHVHAESGAEVHVHATSPGMGTPRLLAASLGARVAGAGGIDKPRTTKIPLFQHGTAGADPSVSVEIPAGGSSGVIKLRSMPTPYAGARVVGLSVELGGMLGTRFYVRNFRVGDGPNLLLSPEDRWADADDFVVAVVQGSVEVFQGLCSYPSMAQDAVAKIECYATGTVGAVGRIWISLLVDPESIGPV